MEGEQGENPVDSPESSELLAEVLVPEVLVAQPRPESHVENIVLEAVQQGRRNQQDILERVRLLRD